MTTQESEGLSPEPSAFEMAVTAAMEEMGEATPVEEVEDLPSETNEPVATGDQATGEASEQDPEQPEDDDQFDFNLEDDDPEEESGEAPEPEGERELDFNARIVQVPGADGPVSINELVQGYLRQSDYTQKTQDIAEQRKQLEEQFKKREKGAQKLWQSLSEDPEGTVAYLATKAGLLNEDEAGKRLASVEGIQLVDEATLESLVNERLEERIQQDPRVQEAQWRAVESRIDSQFRDIENQVGKPLSEKAKTRILEFATEHRLADLRVAFQALRGAEGTKRSQDEAPSVPKSERPKPRSRNTEAQSKKGQILDFEESTQAALAALGIET